MSTSSFTLPRRLLSSSPSQPSPSPIPRASIPLPPPLPYPHAPPSLPQRLPTSRASLPPLSAPPYPVASSLSRHPLPHRGKDGDHLPPRAISLHLPLAALLPPPLAPHQNRLTGEEGRWGEERRPWPVGGPARRRPLPPQI
ncbi:hypothetical protein PVAP13_5NG544550 [Panicum virgatum]|uniref:Uncharacterized protein n=1 Tax=Panicum virgatum TaxID=38727 RepID=A0A8T0S754_PANVG|nr:hypothetical protein PVAP13_5NG544550 [Panicum virgatum]